MDTQTENSVLAVHKMISAAQAARPPVDAMQLTQSALNVANALQGLKNLSAAAAPESPDIKTMVERFLQWKLPATFNPDNGISFFGERTPSHEWPSGTNLLDYTQAEDMVRHILGIDAT